MTTAFTPADSHTIYVGSGNKIYSFDLRMESLLLSTAMATKTYEGAEDEINQIQVNHRATYLAACDDAGDVRVLDLKTHKWMRSLERKHENTAQLAFTTPQIAMTVRFVPKKELQAISGGMDKSIVAWDFYKGRATQLINTGKAGLIITNTASAQYIEYAGFNPNWLVTSASNGTIAVWDDQAARFESMRQQQTLEQAMKKVSLQQQDQDQKALPYGRPLQPLHEFKAAGTFERVNCVSTSRTPMVGDCNKLLYVAGTHSKVDGKKLQGRIAVYQL
ncbi:WD repeat-containing protein 53 [Mortierella sp. GBA43]|nr:WD repeat-containing protein 53 [Mortierella sp. GBA43]